MLGVVAIFKDLSEALCETTQYTLVMVGVVPIFKQQRQMQRVQVQEKLTKAHFKEIMLELENFPIFRAKSTN
jgi:hypothetical protein